MEHVFGSIEPALPPRRRVAVRQILVGGLTLLFAALVVQLQTGWGGAAADAFFEDAVYNSIPLLAGLACALHRSSSVLERRAWMLLGCGFAAWGLGNVYYTFAFADVPTANIPFPSPADAGFLAFYPPVFVGLALLARSQLVRFGRASWLDGVIAGLIVGALGAALVFQPVLESSGGNAAAVATNLAYPLGDVILLALIVGALGLGGWRVSRGWLLISLGLAFFALSDSLYLVRIANDTYEYGSFLDLGWVGASVLVALASLSRVRSRMSEADVRLLPLVPAFFALVGVGLMAYDHFARIHVLALLLTVAGLVAVALRMTLSLLENGRMLRESRTDARTDALTGIGNRRKLQADLELLLQARHGPSHVLLMFDLDGFKGYNDSFGHPAGDALLVRLAGRLAALQGAGGSVYRLGGDEFCLLSRGGHEDVGRLRALGSAALSETGKSFAIRSSCGAAVLPHEAATVSDALRTVDVRMYEDKSSRPSAGKQTMSVLLSALQERDQALARHTGEVAALATEVGRALGLDVEALERVTLAGQLHDIGKIAIPDSIIGKSEGLTEAEWDFMRRHTEIGERIVVAAPALASLGPLVRSSHERWDGAGYPDGLQGERIPLGARIVFACDSYHAMVSARPYQPPVEPADARAELERNAGTQFDPAVVDALLEVLAARDAQPRAA